MVEGGYREGAMIVVRQGGEPVTTVQPVFKFTYEDYRTAPPEKRYSSPA